MPRDERAPNDRILVVEDDPQIADVIKYNLIGAGFQPIMVADGRAAMVEFDRARPSLITIDLNVPEVSGFRLVEVFKRDAPRLPVIVVTALAFEEAEDVARAGADDFLMKPFEPQSLVDKINFHLGGPRLSDPVATSASTRPASPELVHLSAS